MEWVVVTGDSRGLGNAIVKAVLKNSKYGVIGISRSESDEITKTKDKYGERYIHVKFDLHDVEGLKSLYKQQIKTVGPIYGLVNNAAYAYDDIISNADILELEKMYRINVLAPILLSKYCLRDMLLNSTKGSIVHISSVSAHTGYKGLSMYASTKGAIEAFSKGLAREWGGRGIRSNCVSPGFMKTEMSSSLNKELKDKIYARTALKEETSMDSVANTVNYLLSDLSESITGEVIHVNSGTI